MDKLKITGTKSYADVEYKGNIARFCGDLCVDSYNQDASNTFKLHFYDNVGNRII